MKPEAFRIDVSQTVLVDLQERLRETRWPARSHDRDEWKFGTSGAFLKELATYWMSDFDWRKQEESLNEFAQFKARIGDAQIHFVHEKSQNRLRRQLPLLLLHGWPDSFHRYYKVIRPLAAGRDGKAFDVVVPSLPGFGFTGCVRFLSNEQPTRQSATLLWRLMTEVLGYEKFAVAGGDGGGAIAQILAIDHPDSVIGIHLTDLGWHVGNVDPSRVSKVEQKYPS